MSLEADIACPLCKEVISLPITEMVPGRSTACPKCGNEFIVSAADGERASVEIVDRIRSLET